MISGRDLTVRVQVGAVLILRYSCSVAGDGLRPAVQDELAEIPCMCLGVQAVLISASPVKTGQRLVQFIVQAKMTAAGDSSDVWLYLLLLLQEGVLIST